MTSLALDLAAAAQHGSAQDRSAVLLENGGPDDQTIETIPMGHALSAEQSAVSKSIATSFIANSLVKNSILQPRIDVAIWIQRVGVNAGTELPSQAGTLIESPPVRAIQFFSRGS
jgi:hypothetical protein